MKVIEILKSNEYSLNEIVEYYYKIIENNVSIEVAGTVDSNLVYGIQVDKISIDKKGNEKVESEKVDVISSNLDLVREFCRILHKNLVSPVHLVDVLDDNISKVFRLDSKIKFIEKVM